jgi:predicted NACHT family NTPase
LLLDGLDEMAVTISANAVSTIREQLQGWIGKARVVLTSRLNVWDARVNNPLSNFDTYKTLDFTDEQVEEFIVVYYISSLFLPAVDFAQGIRGHWGIENRLH